MIKYLTEENINNFHNYIKSYFVDCKSIDNIQLEKNEDSIDILFKTPSF
ncbi:gp335 [Bacillus phage G]|uniref:Gp335 n=1 Tax=Bacillus phage G TaxID=2884420 RepID=G3MA76_9CAUD|nr:gp335 [Bacillus phage G]AEO93594.1 gp335 [Bacillus phage G]